MVAPHPHFERVLNESYFPPAGRGKTTRLRGFTLIELLITAAIISISALIATPNLLNALQNAKQKRTMTSIKTLGAAVEQYSIDHSNYPLQTTCGTAEKIRGSIKAYTRGNKKLEDSSDDSEAVFSDGWGNPLRYHSALAQSYTLCSGGKDGSNCCTPDAPPGPISQFEKDLIYFQGSFITFPEGKQQ